MTTTTKTSGIEWVVVRDGRLASLHRERAAATRAAKRDGLVLSVERECPEMVVGDAARDFGGQVLPR